MFNPHIERDLAAVKVAELHRQAAAHRRSRPGAREGEGRRTSAPRLRVPAPAPAIIDGMQDCCA